jgi:hypothetical protein
MKTNDLEHALYRCSEMDGHRLLNGFRNETAHPKLESTRELPTEGSGGCGD